MITLTRSGEETFPALQEACLHVGFDATQAQLISAVDNGIWRVDPDSVFVRVHQPGTASSAQNEIHGAYGSTATASRPPCPAQVSHLPDGWEVALTTWHATGMTAPSTRPQLARLLHAIRAGELNGLIAPSRTDISAFPDIYEDSLRTLHAYGGFLALVRDETEL
ncbi:hypothetical protein ACIP6P_31215 [Streptomyces sp. NPDC088729]|uniref:hypothetical protein n=1 Tax=Streptomyces sp. NPDC088729 TaxID=3365876 RepID=UPI0038042681